MNLSQVDDWGEMGSRTFSTVGRPVGELDSPNVSFPPTTDHDRRLDPSADPTIAVAANFVTG